MVKEMVQKQSDAFSQAMTEMSGNRHTTVRLRCYAKSSKEKEGICREEIIIFPLELIGNTPNRCDKYSLLFDLCTIPRDCFRRISPIMGELPHNWQQLRTRAFAARPVFLKLPQTKRRWNHLHRLFVLRFSRSYFSSNFSSTSSKRSAASRTQSGQVRRTVPGILPFSRPFRSLHSTEPFCSAKGPIMALHSL